MRRVKLPGNEKYKKVLLCILVVVSISIILKTAVENRREKNRQQAILEEQRLEDERLAKEEERIKNELKEQEDTLYNQAYNLFFSNKYKESIDVSNELIDKFPESYRGYNIRGIAKAFNGSFDEGMNDINKSLEIKPDYGYGLFNKALNYELYNKLDDALEWYDKALSVEEYMWSYYGKASIYGRRGDAENTVKYLKKAIEVAAKENNDQALKDDAKTEHDFDPVRGNEEFDNLINS